MKFQSIECKNESLPRRLIITISFFLTLIFLQTVTNWVRCEDGNYMLVSNYFVFYLDCKYKEWFNYFVISISTATLCNFNFDHNISSELFFLLFLIFIFLFFFWWCSIQIWIYLIGLRCGTWEFSLVSAASSVGIFNL